MLLSFSHKNHLQEQISATVIDQRISLYDVEQRLLEIIMAMVDT